MMEFVFVFTDSKPLKRHTLRVPISLPASSLRVNELAARIIHAHRLPCFVEEDLKAKLKQFVETESDRIKDEAAEKALHAMKADGANR